MELQQITLLTRHVSCIKFCNYRAGDVVVTRQWGIYKTYKFNAMELEHSQGEYAKPSLEKNERKDGCSSQKLDVSRIKDHSTDPPLDNQIIRMLKITKSKCQSQWPICINVVVENMLVSNIKSQVTNSYTHHVIKDTPLNHIEEFYWLWQVQTVDILSTALLYYKKEDMCDYTVISIYCILCILLLNVNMWQCDQYSTR